MIPEHFNCRCVTNPVEVDMDEFPALEPGWYLLGRKDGVVDEVLVNVREVVEGRGVWIAPSKDRHVRQFVKHAQVHPEEWWWRQVDVEPVLPMHLDEDGSAVWSCALPPPIQEPGR